MLNPNNTNNPNNTKPTSVISSILRGIEIKTW